MSRISKSQIVVLRAIGTNVPIQLLDFGPALAASLGNGADFFSE